MAKDMTYPYVLAIVLIVAIVGIVSMYSGGGLTDLTGMAIDVDTDEDGLPNKVEMGLGTDPENPDSDGDGIEDGEEAAMRSDPLDADDPGVDRDEDTDGDGIANIVELRHGTDPEEADSDGDGYDDGEEVDAGTDPLDGDDYAMPDLANVEEDFEITAISATIITVDGEYRTDDSCDADATATIINDGSVDISESGVVFRYYIHYGDASYDVQFRAYESTFDIGAGESVSLEFSDTYCSINSDFWSLLADGDDVDVTIKMRLDDDDDVDESDEENNEDEFDYTVSSSIATITTEEVECTTTSDCDSGACLSGSTHGDLQYTCTECSNDDHCPGSCACGSDYVCYETTTEGDSTYTTETLCTE
jgi:hypothetical protein